MRKAVRAIVIKDNKLLIMHRNKFGVEYENLPGGSIEIGETDEQALYRELAEETCVVVKNPRLVYIQHSDHMYGDQRIFLCDYVSGEPALHPDSEEAHIHALGKNLYEPKWLPVDQIESSNFIFMDLQRVLLKALNNGWPDQVQEFTSTRNV